MGLTLQSGQDLNLYVSLPRTLDLPFLEQSVSHLLFRASTIPPPDYFEDEKSSCCAKMYYISYTPPTISFLSQWNNT